MKFGVLVFPGSNCDRDCKVAIERSTGAAVDMVWHGETALPDRVDLIVLPGGFAYGDYLRCGAMASLSPVMGAVRAAAERGVAVAGICNGFQILCEARMLPGALLRNAGLKYVCKSVELEVVNGQTRFTAGYAGQREVTEVQVVRSAAFKRAMALLKTAVAKHPGAWVDIEEAFSRFGRSDA